MEAEARVVCPSISLPWVLSPRAGSRGNAWLPRPFAKGNNTLSFPPHLVISETQSSPDDVAGSLEACVFFPREVGGENQGG